MAPLEFCKDFQPQYHLLGGTEDYYVNKDYSLHPEIRKSNRTPYIIRTQCIISTISLTIVLRVTKLHLRRKHHHTSNIKAFCLGEWLLPHPRVPCNEVPWTACFRNQLCTPNELY